MLIVNMKNTNENIFFLSTAVRGGAEETERVPKVPRVVQADEGQVRGKLPQM